MNYQALVPNLSKKELAINFLQSLINCPQFKPFLKFDHLQYGMFDFAFIIKKQSACLLNLRDQIKSKRQFSIQNFISEVKRVFSQISEYILLDDPLQATCQLGLNMIENFEYQLKNRNRKKKRIEQSNQKAKIPNLASQIEMIYYLKNYEHDEQMLRKIGQVSNILNQSEDQYIFDLSSSLLWEGFIQKSDYN